MVELHSIKNQIKNLTVTYTILSNLKRNLLNNFRKHPSLIDTILFINAIEFFDEKML